MIKQGHIEKFWQDQYKNLSYERSPFNDEIMIDKWISMGYQGYFGGDVYDMRNEMPDWSKKFLNLFDGKNCTMSFFRMRTSDILPTHTDTYQRYIEVHKTEKILNIRRIIIFLEDWRPGHIFEITNQPITNWSAGDYVSWNYDTPHMAANLGLSPRYTLQLTLEEVHE